MQEIVYHYNYELEESYWWFVARNRIIKDLTAHYSGLSKGAVVLDVGAGTGGFAKLISESYSPICMDTSDLALDYCKKRGLPNIYKGLLSDFVATGEHVDGVFMLDVVEHIEDDKGVVEQVYGLLPDNGAFVVSVPAYMWLWSRHDVMHMHYRRYTKKRLNKLLQDAGFQIEYSTYFNTFLFFPAVLKRFYDKLKGEKDEYRPVDDVSLGVNKMLTRIFLSESKLLKHFTFPFGVSILTIARKLG